MYWALVLEPGWVQSAIWQIQDGEAKILSTSPVSAWVTDEELVDASDTSLSAAIQSLPEDVKEPQTTVFGVPTSWVSDGQIKDEYLQKIKKICTELSLTPSGFVVLSEAISNLYKSEEGAPVSAIILGVTKENLEVSVFRMGNLVGSTTVSRSVSAFDDLVEGLTRFATTEPLPSRILIYDGKEGELEDIAQEITQKDWNDVEKIKFLHTPKVEILSPERKVSAVALAGAAEIGDVKGIETLSEENESDESTVLPELHQNLETPAEDLGFVVGEDVAKKEEQTPQNEDYPVKEVSEAKEPRPTFETSKITLILNSFFNNLKNLVSTLPFLNKKPGVPKQNLMLFGVIGLLFSVVAFLVYWWFVPKAEITIYVSPQTLSEEVIIVVGEETDNSIEKRQLSGNVEQSEVSGEESASVTGRKIVGEAAKGQVTIRNGTSSDIELSAGTVLISSGNLRFVLTEGASVVAALSPNSPGTASVSVEASAIGAEYNLAKDESFKVGNYPKADVDAVAESDLSGGSSREISAVSLEDRQNLLDSLEQELLSQASNKISGNIPSEKILLSESLKITEREAAFSSEVGEETGEISLNLTLSVSGLSVERDSLFEISKAELKDRIPEGYVLRGEQIQTDFELLGEDEGVYEFETRINANLLPEVKTDEIARQIAGRVPARAEEFLNSIPGFSQAEIRLSPKLPGIFGTIPRINKNIQIEIAAQR